MHEPRQLVQGSTTHYPCSAGKQGLPLGSLSAPWRRMEAPVDPNPTRGHAMTTHTASSRRLATFAAGALILGITGCGATPAATPTMEPVAAKAIAPVRVSLLSPRGGA